MCFSLKAAIFIPGRRYSVVLLVFSGRKRGIKKRKILNKKTGPKSDIDSSSNSIEAQYQISPRMIDPLQTLPQLPQLPQYTATIRDLPIFRPSVLFRWWDKSRKRLKPGAKTPNTGWGPVMTWHLHCKSPVWESCDMIDGSYYFCWQYENKLAFAGSALSLCFIIYYWTAKWLAYVSWLRW